MFDGRKIESAIRKVYSCLYPNKKERKKALARLDMEKLVQSIRYRSETPLAYYTGGSADLSMKYRGPDLFEQKACRIFQEPVQVYSTLVEGTYLRELWLLEDGTFVEVAAVSVKCRFTTESYSTAYRTIRHTMTEKDWSAYVPEEAVDMFEDFSEYPFDGEKGAIYEV